MILIFEQDTRPRDGRRFTWRPILFRGTFAGRKTWRIGWGLWSLSYYPSPGLREFFEHVEGGAGKWHSPPAHSLDTTPAAR